MRDHKDKSAHLLTATKLTMADIKKQRLVYAILQFLKSSIQDGTINEEGRESIEVAGMCLIQYSLEIYSTIRFARSRIAPL